MFDVNKVEVNNSNVTRNFSKKFSEKERRQLNKVFGMKGFIAESAMEELEQSFPSGTIKMMLKLAESDDKFVEKLENVDMLMNRAHRDYRRYTCMNPETHPDSLPNRKIAYERKNDFYAWYLIDTIELLYGKKNKEYTKVRDYFNFFNFTDKAKELVNDLAPIEFMVYAVKNRLHPDCNCEDMGIAWHFDVDKKFIEAIGLNLYRLIDSNLTEDERGQIAETGEWEEYMEENGGKRTL